MDDDNDLALAKKDAEIKRLQAIIDTHNLCHDLHGKVGVHEFAQGCAQEIKQHFGECPWEDEIHRLNQWVVDLQSGMYLNCIFCGHRYGPLDEVTPTQVVLSGHIQACPKHLLSRANEMLHDAWELLTAVRDIKLQDSVQEWLAAYDEYSPVNLPQEKKDGSVPG